MLHQSNYWDTSPSATNPGTKGNLGITASWRKSPPYWSIQKVAEHHDFVILASDCVLSSILYCCSCYHGNRGKLEQNAGVEHHQGVYLFQVFVEPACVLPENEGNQASSAHVSFVLC